jgi:hypothetical protein
MAVTYSLFVSSPFGQCSALCRQQVRGTLGKMTSATTYNGRVCLLNNVVMATPLIVLWVYRNI